MASGFEKRSPADCRPSLIRSKIHRRRAPNLFYTPFLHFSPKNVQKRALPGNRRKWRSEGFNSEEKYQKPWDYLRKTAETNLQTSALPLRHALSGVAERRALVAPPPAETPSAAALQNRSARFRCPQRGQGVSAPARGAPYTASHRTQWCAEGRAAAPPRRSRRS